jgi:hypothetical protein
MRQPHRDQARPRPAAIAHREIDVPGREIRQRLARPHVDVDVGMPAVEVGQARDQPVRGERGQHADGQRPVRPRAQFRDATGDAVQRLAHRGGEHATRLGEFHAATPPVEQRHAELAFQSLHLMADRPVRDMQFGAGAGEILVAGGGLEGAQRGKRGQAAWYVV